MSDLNAAPSDDVAALQDEVVRLRGLARWAAVVVASHEHGGCGRDGLRLVARDLAAAAAGVRPAVPAGMRAGLGAPGADPQAWDPALGLVARFAGALYAKLEVAQRKPRPGWPRGYQNDWQSADWMDACRRQLVEHVAKGDPRDVAALSAFLWHHGESTASPDMAAALRALLASAGM